MKHLSTGKKIFMVVLISLSVYILLTVVFSQRILDYTIRQQLNQGIRQSSDLLISGIEAELDNYKSLSHVLMQDYHVRSWLRGETDLGYNTKRSAERFLVLSYVAFPGISSVYVFAERGDHISAKRDPTYRTFEYIQETNWHQHVKNSRGAFYISLNADGTIFSDLDSNNISLIRQIMLSDYSVGFLVINLSESFIADIINDIKEKHNTNFHILDENGMSVLKGQEIPEWSADIPADGGAKRVDGEMMFLYEAPVSRLGWTVLSSTPYEIPGNMYFSMLIVFIPMACAVLLYVVSSTYTARVIAKPLEKDNQRYELDTLTQQFKPHFLYNTLDSISYLILSGNGSKAYETIVALSRFYRASVNKGQEIITLEHEIEMIKDYLVLQKMRYDDMIDDRYEIAPDVSNAFILRGILQPLVENSIYHGIKPSGEPGFIRISARNENGRLFLTVADNGLGMSPKVLKEMDNRKIKSSLAGFGLRGTIKRLSLFYGQDDIYEIKSAAGEGTAVILMLPLLSETEKAEVPNG